MACMATMVLDYCVAPAFSLIRSHEHMSIVHRLHTLQYAIHLMASSISICQAQYGPKRVGYATCARYIPLCSLRSYENVCAANFLGHRVSWI